MSQQEEQSSEQTLVASFEFVETEPVQALFSISPNIADLNYIHYQDSPQDTWIIQHNLDKYPSVTVVNSAGEIVQADVTYLDSNSIRVEFIGAFAGKAFIN